jgi:hypothetical protein
MQEAVLRAALADHALEVVIIQLMVRDLHGQALLARIQR